MNFTSVRKEKSLYLAIAGAFLLVACANGSGSSPKPSVATPQVKPLGPPLDHDAGSRPGTDFNAPAASDADVDFDPEKVLDTSMGRWIDVGTGTTKTRFFTPTLAADEADWQPYQHGRWVFDPDPERGWTWYSYDRWGFVTDHYGIWRHMRYQNENLWVWLPIPGHKYRPHLVTWFSINSYVGWYPYYAEYPDAYTSFGAALGFNDGFWEGYQIAGLAGQPGMEYILGFTVVSRIDVTNVNIFDRRLTNQAEIFKIAARANSPAQIEKHLVGPIPGGKAENAHGFLDPKGAAPITRVKPHTLANGSKLLQTPAPSKQLPASEAQRRTSEKQSAGVKPNALAKPEAKAALPGGSSPPAKPEEKLIPKPEVGAHAPVPAPLPAPPISPVVRPPLRTPPVIKPDPKQETPAPAGKAGQKDKPGRVKQAKAGSPKPQTTSGTVRQGNGRVHSAAPIAQTPGKPLDLVPNNLVKGAKTQNAAQANQKSNLPATSGRQAQTGPLNGKPPVKVQKPSGSADPTATPPAPKTNEGAAGKATTSKAVATDKAVASGGHSRRTAHRTSTQAASASAIPDKTQPAATPHS